MARVIITVAGEDVVVGGNIDVIGTTAPGEVITVVSGRIALNSSFNTGGDTINLPGSASDYQVSVQGTVVTLVGPDATLVIPAGPNGTAITFDGGTDSRTLVFDANAQAFVLGDQTIGATAQSLAATDTANTIVTVSGFDGSQSLDGGDGYDVLVATLAPGAVVPDGAPFSGFERLELLAPSGGGIIEFDLNDVNAPSQGEVLVVDASAFGDDTQIFLSAYPDVSAYRVELIGGAAADYLDADNGRGGDIVRGGGGGDELWAGNSAADGRGDFAYGGEGDDFLNSIGRQINALFGEEGDDQFFVYGNAPTYADGGAGNDSFFFQTYLGLEDRVIGGPGQDRLLVTTLPTDAALAVVSGVEMLEIEEAVDIALGQGFVISGISAVAVFADSGNRLDASGISRSIALSGGAGADELTGGSAGDVIAGGGGADVLTGGAGADLFVYRAQTDSIGADGRDTITDFTSGQDRIDLTAAFASETLAYVGSFDNLAAASAAIGAGTETSFAFISGAGGGTLIVDSDGDGAFTDADFQIRLEGVSPFDPGDVDAAVVTSAVVSDLMLAPFDDAALAGVAFG